MYHITDLLSPERRLFLILRQIILLLCLVCEREISQLFRLPMHLTVGAAPPVSLNPLHRRFHVNAKIALKTRGRDVEGGSISRADRGRLSTNTLESCSRRFARKFTFILFP